MEGIVRIANATTEEKIFNLGSGKGTSINQVIEQIEDVIGEDVARKYIDKRSVDVAVNYLDISRFERNLGKLELKSLEEGIKLTVDFFRRSEQLEDKRGISED